jgi:hypothetical protein
MTLIPASHQDLLTRPLFAHLATIRPDGTPQANPMWFAWDGSASSPTGTNWPWTGRPGMLPTG